MSTRLRLRRGYTSSEKKDRDGSLQKSYSFALRKASEKDDAPETKQPKKKVPLPAKVYYVEEQVKVLSEIIQKADPILSELYKEISAFHKIVDSKETSTQRDLNLYRRYGRYGFASEKKRLNISFHSSEEIAAL